MKLFSMFHWRMVALGYHVHCGQNRRTQRLFIALDSRSRVTVAEWPLWCFPLPTDTDTELSRTLGPHGLGLIQCYNSCTVSFSLILYCAFRVYELLFSYLHSLQVLCLLINIKDYPHAQYLVHLTLAPRISPCYTISQQEHRIKE